MGWTASHLPLLVDARARRRSGSSGDGEAKRGWGSANFIALLSSSEPRDRSHRPKCQRSYDVVEYTRPLVIMTATTGGGQWTRIAWSAGVGQRSSSGASFGGLGLPPRLVL